MERPTSEHAEATLSELLGPASRRSPGAVDRLSATVSGLRTRLLEPRLVVGLLLIAACVVWAFVRGLEFYGLSPVNLAYDVDQPPLLLAVVGGWLLYRSRRR